ncbi:hypothetical protein NKI31_24055 [Mesorhizobium sp. M0659]|uniref:hypothetical protein n=1 Tax=Mesorhizobium sp. M0659 TaxID=2956980 RepID=UPI00333B0092
MLNSIAGSLDAATAIAIVRLLIDLMNLYRSAAAKKAPDGRRARSKPIRKRRPRRR